MRGRGLTLLECLLVLALLAGAALVAIPLWTSDRILSNEERAVVVLRRLVEAQESFREQVPGGSYGLMQELCGNGAPRGLQTVQPVLPLGSAPGGVLRRDGYCFTVHLPGRDGDVAQAAKEVDPEQASRFWIAYAWPVHYGITGRRLFGIGPGGTVYALDNAVDSYSGPGDLPPAKLLAHRLEGSPFKAPATRIRNLSWDVIPR